MSYDIFTQGGGPEVAVEWARKLLALMSKDKKDKEGESE